MKTVNIQAGHGGPFISAKAGKSLVKVMPLNAPAAQRRRRLGFMEGQIRVPNDFDQMGAREIEDLFSGRK
jgi:hypothetical protein